MQTYEIHPLADIFPLIEGAEFDQLVEDIRVNGLLESILLDPEERIIDGRNRYRACQVLGIEPRTEVYWGEDIAEIVVSYNLRRRHMDSSQRAMVAARMANMRQGFRSEINLTPDGVKSQAETAEMLNVGRRSVTRAKEVIEHGSSALVEKVTAGKITVATAVDISSLDMLEQNQLLQMDDKAVLARAKEIRHEKAVVRRADRADRINTIAAGNTPLIVGSKRYVVVYADPAWKFEDIPMGDTDRSIENHYPTMPLDEIIALPVDKIAALDAVLYLWSTVPQLRNAMRVIEAWGFTYKSQFIWNKEILGTGYWNRNQHEILLVATRGDIPAPMPGTRLSSVYRGHRGPHSAKPVWFSEMIEKAHPEFSKLELFCRSPRPGWDVWGNESGAPPEAHSKSPEAHSKSPDALSEPLQALISREKAHSSSP